MMKIKDHVAIPMIFEVGRGGRALKNDDDDVDDEDDDGNDGGGDDGREDLPEVGLGGRGARRQAGRGFSVQTRRHCCTDASPIVISVMIMNRITMMMTMMKIRQY